MNSHVLKTAVLVACFAFFGASCQPAEPSKPSWISQRSTQEHTYTQYAAQDFSMDIVFSRPSEADTKVMLAVAGTYTSPSDAVEGFVVDKGNIVQAKERQAWNGALLVKDGKMEILETKNGKLLTPEFLQKLSKEGKTLVQTHLLVKDSKAQYLKEQPKFQRRAFAIMEDGLGAVIESVELIDLQDFANDLVKLGVKDAVNLDMGGWSEGWYRSDKGIVRIGYMKGSTDKQSNWLVFLTKHP